MLIQTKTETKQNNSNNINGAATVLDTTTPTCCSVLGIHKARTIPPRSKLHHPPQAPQSNYKIAYHRPNWNSLYIFIKVFFITFNIATNDGVLQDIISPSVGVDKR